MIIIHSANTGTFCQTQEFYSDNWLPFLVLESEIRFFTCGEPPKWVQIWLTCKERSFRDGLRMPFSRLHLYTDMWGTVRGIPRKLKQCNGAGPDVAVVSHPSTVPGFPLGSLTMAAYGVLSTGCATRNDVRWEPTTAKAARCEKQNGEPALPASALLESWELRWVVEPLAAYPDTSWWLIWIDLAYSWAAILVDRKTLSDENDG